MSKGLIFGIVSIYRRTSHIKEDTKATFLYLNFLKIFNIFSLDAIANFLLLSFFYTRYYRDLSSVIEEPFSSSSLRTPPVLVIARATQVARGNLSFVSPNTPWVPEIASSPKIRAPRNDPLSRHCEGHAGGLWQSPFIFFVLSFEIFY